MEARWVHSDSSASQIWFYNYYKVILREGFLFNNLFMTSCAALDNFDGKLYDSFSLGMYPKSN